MNMHEHIAITDFLRFPSTSRARSAKKIQGLWVSLSLTHSHSSRDRIARKRIYTFGERRERERKIIIMRRGSEIKKLLFLALRNFSLPPTQMLREAQGGREKEIRRRRSWNYTIQ
jgi:hypothetical protein